MENRSVFRLQHRDNCNVRQRVNHKEATNMNQMFRNRTGGRKEGGQIDIPRQQFP